MSGFGYNVLGFGGGGPPPIEVDDEFNRVSFLSHFDGANNGVNNAFDDGSASNHTITESGNTPVQGSFGPFARPEGEFSVHLDGNDHLTVAASNDFDLSDGDITWEMFVNPSQATTAGGNQLTLFEYFNSGAFFRFIIYVVNGSFNISIFQRYDGDYPLSADNVAPANTWSHVACTRDSNNEHKIFVNGVTVATSTNDNDPMPTAGLPLVIGLGQLTPGGRYFPGHISNFRLTKGSLVYTSDFTPPSAPLTAITNCKLLTCQSNRFVDNSASAHTVTPTGNPKVSAFGPFLTNAAYDPAVNGASMYAPLYTDYLRIPNSSEFELDANFSVEFWVNLDADFNNALSIFIWANNNSQTQLGQGSGNQLYFYRGAQIIQNTSVIAKSGGWNHIALCRSGSVLSYYCNGVRIGTASYTSTVDFSDAYVMTYDPDTDQYGANGYMSDLRILKGSSAYDASQTTLTVPTASLTAITNTKLLLNMANGQAIDSAAQNNLYLLGGTKISNTQSKFGGTSLALDGSGDYAQMENSSSLNLGGGDFTVECWVYTTETGQQCIVGAVKGSDGTGAWMLNLNYNSAQVRFFCRYNGGSVLDYQVGSGNFTTNSFKHLAVTRNGANLRVFIDGTQVGTTNTTLSIHAIDPAVHNAGTPYYIGRTTDGSLEFAGYLDDLRVSKMARYTSNFTAPSAPFADQGKE